MVTYYVDSAAAAGGDGSAGTPWDAIADVNAGATDNDTVMLARGSTWHEELVVPGVNMTFTPYGTGANPFIGKLDTNSKTGLSFDNDIDFGPWLSVNQLAYGTIQNCCAGIGFNKRVFAGETGGKIQRLYDGAISNVYTSTKADRPRMMFVDSRDYLYICWEDSKLIRTVDYGANFTQVMSFAEADGCGNSMTEDDQGNLYIGEYQGTVAFGAKVYKSTTNGDSFTDITENLALPINTYKHVHGIHWWAAKSAVVVALGDAGNDGVYYSTDYGSTWTQWTGVVQMVSFASDDNYLYMTADAAGNRSIYRATALGGSVTKVYDVTDSVLAWNIHVTPEGYIVAFFSKEVDDACKAVISYDSGDHWFVHANWTTPLVIEWALPSQYNTSWDKWYYGGNALIRNFAACGVHDARHNLYIDATNGVDYVNSGDVDAPWKTIEAGNVWLQNGPKHLSGIKMLSSASDASLIIQNNSTIDGNKYGCNYASAAPAFSNGMEGANPYDSSTSGNATFTYDDATQPHVGAKSTSIVSTGAGVVNSFGNKVIAPDATSGNTLYVRGYCYIANDITTVNYYQIMSARPIDDSSGVHIRTNNTKIPWILIVNSPYYQPDLSEKTLAVTTWYKFKISVYVHATKGIISFWIDDDLVIKLIGLNTVGTADWGKG